VTDLLLRDVLVDLGGLRVEIDRFEVAAGSRLVLFGPNGAGKTTLLRLLAGRIPGGHTGACAYLPQRPWAFRGRAGRTLRLGLDGAAHARAKDLVATLGVGDLLDRPTRSLSGGERQRLALARVLARPEDVVLLDEPLAAIGAADRPRVAGVIIGTLAGRTAVIVTHDRDEAVMLGDEMAVIIDGRIRQRGDVRSVFGLPADTELAAVVGVGNAVSGSVAAGEDGLNEVDLGEITVWGMGELPVGSPAAVLFGGETVTVHAGRHGSPGSARNCWAGRVDRVRDVGRLVEIVVDVGVPVVALLTPGSAEELGVRIGAHVTLAVKATAVRVVPR